MALKFVGFSRNFGVSVATLSTAAVTFESGLVALRIVREWIEVLGKYLIRRVWCLVLMSMSNLLTWLVRRLWDA